MKKRHLAICALLIISTPLWSQDLYPTHWWVGMKNPKLQLIVHQEGIAEKIPMYKLSPAGMKLAEGVTLKAIQRVENPNYVFLDLVIDKNAKPGARTFSFGPPSKAVKIKYELKARSKENGKTRIQGVTQADFIYLLMPDRFANGDPSNDYFTDMRDTGHDRANPFDRHGGDLKGIEDHLDYFNELGVTAIWPTPVVENDMTRTQEGGISRSTYHGYAFTNQYAVDRRLGGNDAYKKLVNAAHSKGIKFIQDAVYNHIGDDHWSIKDMPMKDWVNQWPSYTNSSYKDQPIVDPYASDIDRKLSVNGWFTPFMADLNQRNPLVANFLIQYAIWATEEFGIDGWRIDTYFYSDGEFLNKINDALAKEFPSLTVFGETLVPSVVNAAWFSENNLTVPFKHNCPGITDFPLTNAMIDALRQPFSWTDGVNRLYSTLAQDILYKDPTRNCIFLDNHDLDRIYSVVGEDYNKYKMAINWLLTLRGIPQMYYGTEILMKNFKNPTDAEVRKDFPGGWKEDTVNKFTKEGRTEQEQQAFTYVSSLANFRKTSSAIAKGKLMQYVPQNGLYVYFRYDAKQTVMVISNTGDKSMKPDWNYYAERTTGFKQLKDVVSGNSIPMEGFEIKPKESFVFELLK
ncbi:glycoside hydrolase family 13 protein [Terrimonas pollutisoli]|uniref:glycoside hydrolase family 13 protein n=1 Tax=Terrimonas pollutisoli TaxID=3034147 RepID=UPI0023EE289D|nr:glycoside hydrolase family 13 protein [Terrimonas sp. H1YJ31]